MKKRILFGIYLLLFFVLYPCWLTSLIQGYQQAVKQAKQYDQEQSSAAISQEPLYVNGKDSEYHQRGASDYFLELREAGGRLRRVGVSEKGWANVAQGDTVTGEVWQDKVRLVTDHGQTQQTVTNPHYQVHEQWKNLWWWIGIGLFLAGILIYSNWYFYTNRDSLAETERNDANL